VATDWVQIVFAGAVLSTSLPANWSALDPIVPLSDGLTDDLMAPEYYGPISQTPTPERSTCYLSFATGSVTATQPSNYNALGTATAPEGLTTSYPLWIQLPLDGAVHGSRTLLRVRGVAGSDWHAVDDAVLHDVRCREGGSDTVGTEEPGLGAEPLMELSQVVRQRDTKKARDACCVRERVEHRLKPLRSGNPGKKLESDWSRDILHI
jgi:hypothetical protein